MRLGIYGGTFDPIHYGHLLLAECCREQASLDEVWFVPAAMPPHKVERPPASAEARCEMLQLALAGNDAFRLSRLEIERGGLSYTVDTLAQIRASQPGAELFLLVGADMLLDLPNWRHPQQICQWATLVVVNRQGASPPDAAAVAGNLGLATADVRIIEVGMPRVDFSSNELRLRVGAGLSVRYWTPRAVEQYIGTHRLYSNRSSNPPG